MEEISTDKKFYEDALKRADELMEITVLTSATDEKGEPFYIYLAIPPSKYLGYLETHRLKKPIVFEDYGRVIKTGAGFPPPKEVMAEMEEKENMNHNFQNEIKEALLDMKGKFTAQNPKKSNLPFAKKPQDES